jgi:hypothetical protein
MQLTITAIRRRFCWREFLWLMVTGSPQAHSRSPPKYLTLALTMVCTHSGEWTKFHVAAITRRLRQLNAGLTARDPRQMQLNVRSEKLALAPKMRAPFDEFLDKHALVAADLGTQVFALSPAELGNSSWTRPRKSYTRKLVTA